MANSVEDATITFDPNRDPAGIAPKLSLMQELKLRADAVTAAENANADHATIHSLIADGVAAMWEITFREELAAHASTAAVS